MLCFLWSKKLFSLDTAQIEFVLIIFFFFRFSLVVSPSRDLVTWLHRLKSREARGCSTNIIRQSNIRIVLAKSPSHDNLLCQNTESKARIRFRESPVFNPSTRYVEKACKLDVRFAIVLRVRATFICEGPQPKHSKIFTLYLDIRGIIK